ncbi:MAG: hypothetical protein OEU36_22700 [Gammaproteobacteria bacterium]|nr:hypothetical protein [Gammaproteobacteria bacterium]
MPTLQRIRDLLQQPIPGKVLNATLCLKWIEDVNQQYISLLRQNIASNILVDLKLSIIFWRKKLLHELLTSRTQWANENPAPLVEILAALRIYLQPQQQSQIASILDDNKRYAEIMAYQGMRHQDYPEFDESAGPGVDLDITANRTSSWSFAKWKKNTAFSHYDFVGDGVRYRGVIFRPGDVLLTNVSLDGNGLYTSLTDPKGFCSHSAFFAILEDQDNHYPVLIETYEKGVRPVPLNVFLGPRFCAYAEIYRHHDISEQHTTVINRAAKAIVDSVKGYNFDSEDPDRTYMSCTSVGRFLYQDAGLTPAQTISSLKHPQIKKNLTRLGYTFFELFAPVDYLLNDNFQCVGWVDNNQIERLLAQELVDGRFRQLFSEREIAPENFPILYKLNRWGLRHIRGQTQIGKIISFVEGFDHITLPKGPNELLAIIRLAESQLGKSTVAIRKVVEQKINDMDEFDLDELAADPTVKSVLNRTLELPWLPK